QGRKIKIINARASSGRIDISELVKGIYVIKVYTDKNTGTKLIIKH
ncbi:MAG: hypothetical protein ACI9CQ_004658, partial [Saprospiraceae bacterium]